MAETPLALRPVAAHSPGPRPAPTPSLLRPWVFDYRPSRDGHDLNLLIMFHGLGDTKAPFAQLGANLNLPSTAVLSLQAPDPVPLMDHPSFSWYNTFDALFHPLPAPDPTRPLPALVGLLEALAAPPLGWALSDIHLFGWGQGGTVALELALRVGVGGVPVPVPVPVPGAGGSGGEEGSAGGGNEARAGGGKEKSAGDKARRLGSATSICAGLLSHPSAPLSLETPVCLFTRLAPSSAAAATLEAVARRAFAHVDVVRPSTGIGPGRGDDMPRQKEWEGVMRFWAGVLRGNDGWKGADVYEVVR
ncbi:hypothetical protein Q5752_003138 [Cryptotrichosporon argae]